MSEEPMNYRIDLTLHYDIECGEGFAVIAVKLENMKVLAAELDVRIGKLNQDVMAEGMAPYLAKDGYKWTPITPDDHDRRQAENEESDQEE